MKNEDFKHNEFVIMQDLWKAYKANYEAPDMNDKDWWGKCVDELTAVYDRYKTDLAKDLMNAFFNDIVRRAKETRDGKA